MNTPKKGKQVLSVKLGEVKEVGMDELDASIVEHLNHPVDQDGGDLPLMEEENSEDNENAERLLGQPGLIKLADIQNFMNNKSSLLPADNQLAQIQGLTAPKDQPVTPISGIHCNNGYKPWFDLLTYDTYDTASSILVLLPSWRDPDVFNTILDLFITANNPSRVHVLALMQIEGDVVSRHWNSVSELNLNACLANHGIDTNHISWMWVSSNKVRGAGAARKLALSYAQSFACDYVMGLDCHSRFALGWDTYLVSVSEYLMNNGFELPVLSNLPHGFEIEGELDLWAKNGSTAPNTTVHWSEDLGYIRKRMEVVSKCWNVATNYDGIYNNIPNLPFDFSKVKRLDPHVSWERILEFYNKGKLDLQNSDFSKNPVFGKDGIENMSTGFLSNGVIYYLGQTIADYSTRIKAYNNDPEHPYRKVIDAAKMGYKIVGGLMFMPSYLARNIEFSSYFKSDDEIIPSMRLIRAGASLFTANFNVVFHWYGRPNMPRPGWSYEVYDLSNDAMISELGMLGYDSKWREKVDDSKYSNQRKVNKHLRDAGFVENKDDVVMVKQHGVRRENPETIEYYYNKIGLHRAMLFELEVLACDSKKQLEDLDLVLEIETENTNTGKIETLNYVRPFYLRNDLNALVDILNLKDRKFILQMFDYSGEVVGFKYLNASDTVVGPNNNTIKILGNRKVKIECTVFCDPKKPVPIEYRLYSMSVVDGTTTKNISSPETLIFTSELYSESFRQYVRSLGNSKLY